MSHRAIRTFIEDTAKSLATNIQFTYARTSDFNIIKDKKYPYIVLDPLSASPAFAVDGVSNYMKSWSCNMAFYQLDSTGSTADEYKLILDQMDEYVDKFINKLNRNSYLSDSVIIEGVSQTPFIKTTADVLTGFLLSFTLVASDTFDYCSVDCELTGDECRTD